MPYALRRLCAGGTAGRRPATSLLVTALTLLLLFAVEAAGQEIPAPTPVLATWRTQALTFTYQSKQSAYSCESLGEKVWRTLLFLGARPDMHISVRGCEGSDPLRGASAFGFATLTPITLRINIATPYELNPVDREGVTGESGRRDLIRRATGTDPANTDVTEQFPAFWAHVKLSELDHLQAGDCELVDQMQRQLFTKLNVRVVEKRMTCVAGRRFRGEGLFEVETLVQARSPDTASKTN